MREFERFQKWHMPEPMSGCWLWIGDTRRGYGRLSVNGVGVPAHRWSYEHHVGPIPDGLTLDHLCRIRSCVNPDHLEPVSNKENVLRGNGHTAMNARKTHCKRGHPLFGDNLYICGHGGRQCRECHRMLTREWKRRTKKTPRSLAGVPRG